jgi:Flp pilus assembly protein TadD
LRNTLINSAIIAAGVLLVVSLSINGCNSATKEVEQHGSTIDSDHSDHNHEGGESDDHEVADETNSAGNLSLENETSEYDAEIETALANYKKGLADGDMNFAMTQGIFKLRDVLKKDPENVKALYHMGLLSIESGQFDKAIERFEKLILLRPENQEFKNILQDIQAQKSK